MKEKGKNSRWKAIREAFNTLHLWLGVGSGLILFVVCFSGTVYTFSSEIQKLTDSELYTVSAAPGKKKIPAETLIASLLDSLKGNVVQSVVIPESSNASYQITVIKKEKESTEAKQGPKKKKKNDQANVAKGKPGGERRARGTTYFIDPYSGKVLGTGATSSSEFFMFMFRLHRWLLLDMEVGRPIVGIATLIFVIIILSGMVIWFPKKIKNWRQGLKIKTTANWKRINHDLHSALGLYASLFLLVMALTGLTWSFEWYKKGFNNTLGVKPKEPTRFESKITPGANRATIEKYISVADQALPYPGDYRLTLPQDSTGVATLMKTQNSFFATSVADRIVLDQYSAEVIHTELFAEKPLNEKVASSIKALHIGSFYGTFSKIIYFIACLIGTSLPVTGVFIWINKLRKKKKKPETTLVREAAEINV